MTQVTMLSQFNLGDMNAGYLIDDTDQSISLRLLPVGMDDRIVEHRQTLAYFHSPAWRNEPLVQLKLLGDSTGSFSQGMTMRDSQTLASLRYEEQQVVEEGGAITIVTRLGSERGYAVEHYLRWRAGDAALSTWTVFYNRSGQPQTLEMLASFSLGWITPFAEDDAPGRLYLHRFRSAWSAEGRHECRLAEDAGLEPSWTHHGVRVERFGQVGSLPVRGFFPWAGVEDRQAGVMWGAQLAIPGSWQMEFYRRDDFLCLSGGLADREFGHWMKTVAPGEQFASPEAWITAVQGDLDDLCDRLVRMQLPAAEAAPEVEKDLPVICNEWCTSWGNPRHADLVAMADRLKDAGVRYLVIDAGWYKGDDGVWSLSQGDWVANASLFPEGLAATARAIRERGIIPGLWFEMEVVGQQSPRFERDLSHFLHRDGLPITAGGRRFWDFRDPWVIETLEQNVIAQLRDTGLGYIKVDYNETIGIGCDSQAAPGERTAPGEGLRQHLEAVQGFFRRMRAALPDLVIENCASGGHRLEPSMTAITSMSSFSDAHETRDIPLIAANLHRLILPRQSQIWAVLHASDTAQRLAYLLTSGFLGRLCLSGEIPALDEGQWALVKEAIGFYQLAAPVIARGKSRVYQAVGPSWQHPTGAQVVSRVSDGGEMALVVMHSFGAPLPAGFQVPLPGEGWRELARFPQPSAGITLQGDRLACTPQAEWQGSAVLLKRD